MDFTKKISMHMFNTTKELARKKIHLNYIGLFGNHMNNNTSTGIKKDLGTLLIRN